METSGLINFMLFISMHNRCICIRIKNVSNTYTYLFWSHCDMCV